MKSFRHRLWRANEARLLSLVGVLVELFAERGRVGA